MKFKKALAMVLAGAMALSLQHAEETETVKVQMTTRKNQTAENSLFLSGILIRSLESKRFSQISQKRQELKQSLLW